MPPAPVRSISLLPHGRRVWLALAVVLAVLLLHAALLGLLQRTLGGPAPGTVGVAARPLQVRQVVLRAAVPVAQADAAPASETPLPLTAPRSSRRSVAREPAPAAPASEPPAPDPFEPAETSAAQPTDNDTEAGASGEAAPEALPAGTPLPTYATRLPPPATLQYTVLRGGPGAVAATPPVRAALQAQLIWRPDAAAATYTLSLGLGASLGQVGSASVGALDLHGIAPERHVETRRGREVRAANFQRQPGVGGGRISFSGPRIEHPLLPGVQDRLSWMLQLPGVLEAAPALAQPGREVTLFVVGVRGDAALWAFRVIAVQTLQLPAGEVVNAVHLRREPERPYDTRVDVWLDPARHHLPVRLRLQNRADGPATEFELLRLTF